MPCIGRQSPNCWTAGEGPPLIGFHGWSRLPSDVSDCLLLIHQGDKVKADLSVGQWLSGGGGFSPQWPCGTLGHHSGPGVDAPGL